MANQNRRNIIEETDKQLLLVSDVWNIEHLSCSKLFNHFHKDDCIMDFSPISNCAIKQQCKNYLIACLEQNNPSTVKSNFRRLLLLSQYLSKYNTDIKTITAINKRFLVNDFENFLQSSGYKTSYFDAHKNMMMPSVNIQVVKKFYDFIFYTENICMVKEQVYEKDIWDLQIFPSYADIDFKERNQRILYFSSMKNLAIKNESKSYLLDNINQKMKPKTISQHYHALLHIAAMVDTKYPSLNSIVNINFVELDTEFLKYLDANCLRIEAKTVRITRDMEIKESKSRSLMRSVIRQFYLFVSMRTNKEECRKDVWDIRNFGIQYRINPSIPNYQLTFNITQDWLKKDVKDFIWFMIPNRAFSSLLQYISGLHTFSVSLLQSNSNAVTIHDVSKTDMLEYYKYLGEKQFSPSNFNSHITAIKVFFRIMNQIKYNHGLQISKLFKYAPYKKVSSAEPIHFFSHGEIERINTLLEFMPPQLKRILFIAEVTGIRLSDILNLRNDCLKYVENDDYLLTFYMRKVKRSHHLIIDVLTAGVIKSAIEDSQEVFPESQFVFAKSSKLPLSRYYVVTNLNRLSFDHNIKDDEGKKLRIEMHMFRRTLATNLFAEGYSPDKIKTVLGQKHLGVLSHYISISRSQIADAAKPILAERETWIQLDGMPIPEHDVHLALPLGACNKKEICEHANRCYTCALFTPSIHNIGLYRRQQADAIRFADDARNKGMTVFAEKNQSIADALEQIICKLEKQMNETNISGIFPEIKSS